jgi:hypothetical protein
MWAAGLDPFIELEPEEVQWVSPVLSQYNLFMQAKNLGIKISPSDIDIGTLGDLSTISTAISDVQERKNKRKRR